MRIFRAGSPVFLPLTDKWVLIKKVILENRCFLLAGEGNDRARLAQAEVV
jgi:hypothetical protein